MFEAIWSYVLDNKEWIFSGIGIFIITMFFAIFRRKKADGHKISQKQKSGDSSVSIQIGNIEK